MCLVCATVVAAVCIFGAGFRIAVIDVVCGDLISKAFPWPPNRVEDLELCEWRVCEVARWSRRSRQLRRSDGGRHFGTP